jgi:FeS assembly protein IscX
MAKLNWSNAEDVAIALYEAHEGVNPLSVSFVQMHRWICELPEFGGEPNASSEGALEGIQMAWLDEWKYDNE